MDALFSQSDERTRGSRLRACASPRMFHERQKAQACGRTRPAPAGLANGTPGPSIRFGLVFLLLLALPGSQALGTTQAVSREYQVKAAFLYNFTKFVDWPPERFDGEDSPLVIGVLGRNPFGNELKESVRERQIDNRGIVVKSIASPREAENIHLLFVASGEETLLNGALSSLHESSVLTVGESETFNDLGGIITFTLKNGRVRFFINRDAVENSDLRISAQMLQLALAPR